MLAADIKRTRQAYAMFKREEVMQVVSQVLERWACGNGYMWTTVAVPGTVTTAVLVTVVFGSR